MKILITGGAGYIGSVLTTMLLEVGHKVTVIDNFMYHQNSLLCCCHSKNLTVINGDTRNPELIEKNIIGKDFIIPLACLVGAPACDKDPSYARSVIIDGMKHILKYRKENQGIIYPNTNSGYGVGQSNKYCDENSPLKPLSLYAKLKVDAEKMLLKTDNTISLRLATVFGISPRMRIDLLVNDFTYRAVNDRFVILFEPHFKRNYIHVRDVARAFIYCLSNFKKMKNNIYNVGLSDANLSKLELCQEIKKQIPNFYFMKADIGEDPDKRDYIVSNKKIEKMGFKPKVTLREGIVELVKGYQILKNDKYKNA